MGGGAGGPDPLKNHKSLGFLSNSGPDLLKNYKATKPAFYVGPSSARKRNASLMAFCLWADDGPHIVVFGSSLPSSTKRHYKKVVKSGSPPTKTLWIRAWPGDIKVRNAAKIRNR